MRHHSGHIEAIAKNAYNLIGGDWIRSLLFYRHLTILSRSLNGQVDENVFFWYLLVFKGILFIKCQGDLTTGGIMFKKWLGHQLRTPSGIFKWVGRYMGERQLRN
ncbi:hypothetical protein D0466_16745 [Peribacillus glennii]|uniref:Uncharacterized protein n=1 Tax=Peribacillus glennii TaxID=2303991 RepID=A0A372L989_9BACI|nr:hypothetical protein D0466_16745 [Peribacillus glennii]